MIYTVTFNPSLDYIVEVKDFQVGMTNRTESEMLLAGGKGINISIVLKELGFENTALGFVAGFTGVEIVKKVRELGVKAEFMEVPQGISRINLKLQSIEGTEINGMGPDISDEQVEQLLMRLEQLEEGDVLCLAGSIPKSMPSDMYQRIMDRLQNKGILVVVDATKELLMKVLPYRPFLIKPNHHELGELFGVRLETREDVVPYGKKLQALGARNVLISMAGEGAVLIAEDGQAYSRPAPKGTLINGVGAGDSMVAGFVAGWLEQQDYEHAFCMGLAAGSASAFSRELATHQEIEAVYQQL